MLRIKDLSVKKSKKVILDDINLKFEKGKVYAIIGVNGAGKSTLLDAIFALNEIHNMRFDDFLLDKSNVKEWQENIGYMLQNFHTHANLSALEVVLLGAFNNLDLKISDDILLKALKILEDFKILDLAYNQISQLSGGQRQMVAFAQVLLKEPKILLLDEPVSALDLRHQCILLEALKQKTKEQNLISIVVLHDLNLASLFCDELVLIHNKQVYKQGSSKDILDKHLIEEIYGVEVMINEYQDKKYIQVIGSK